MNNCTIGKNPKVPRIMLGCWRLGEIPYSQMKDLVLTCVEQGITMFDHAVTYQDGKSEQLFGKVLKNHPELRKQIIIQSKCGIVKDDILYYDFSKDNIIKSVRKSIQRLSCGYLDFLLLHRPDTLMDPMEVAAAINFLYDEGLVKGFGVSNMVPLQMEVLQKYLDHKILINQLQFGPAHTQLVDAAMYMNTNFEQGLVKDGYVLEYCRLHNIRIQAWSILQISRMEGSFLDHPDYQALNTILDEYAKRFKTNKIAVILAWVLYHPVGMQVILGTSKPERIKLAVECFQVQLTKQDWYKIYIAGTNKTLL